MNLAVFLAALSAVETGANDTLVGTHGERSRFQITATVWNQQAPEWDFKTWARDAHRAEVVVNRQMRWFMNHQVPADTFHLAAAWHLGLKRFKSWGEPRLKTNCDFALRVERIYNRLLQRQR